MVELSPPIASNCIDPNIALHPCLSRLLGNLRMFGRDPTDIIPEIAVICFFPYKTIEKLPSDINTLNYAYSSTRPTLNQIRPYRLVPIIPMAPLNICNLI